MPEAGALMRGHAADSFLAMAADALDDDDRVERRVRRTWAPRRRVDASDDDIAKRIREGLTQAAIRAEFGCGQARVQRVAKEIGHVFRVGARAGDVAGRRSYRAFRTGATMMNRGTVGLPDDWRAFVACYDEIEDAIVLRVVEKGERIRADPIRRDVECDACDAGQHRPSSKHHVACNRFITKARARRGES